MSNDHVILTEGNPATNEGQVGIRVEVKTHPDGGWGWVVCFAAFFIQFLVLGMQNCFGIVYTALVDTLKTDRGATAWVGSLATGWLFFFGPLTTSLCERFGCRIVTIIGALLCITGMLLSSFASGLPVLYVTYGITWGTGTSLCYFPTLISLSKYFKKRLALVNGIVTSGSGVGTLTLGPLVQMALRHFGVANALRLFAGVIGFVVLLGCTFRPVPLKYAQYRQEPTGKSRSFFDYSIFKNKGYIVWTCCMATFMLGYFVPFVHLVRHAEDLGVHPTKASFLIGYMSVASTVGRLFFGKLADFKCLNRMHIYQTGFLMMSVSSFLLPEAKGYAGLVLYSLAFGFFEGCYVVLIPVLVNDIVGQSKMSYGLGSMFTIMAFPMMVGPPIAGWIYESSGNYSIAFYLCGSTSAISACMMFGVSCLIPEHVDSNKTKITLSPKDNQVVENPNHDIILALDRVTENKTAA